MAMTSATSSTPPNEDTAATETVRRRGPARMGRHLERSSEMVTLRRSGLRSPICARSRPACLRSSWRLAQRLLARALEGGIAERSQLGRARDGVAVDRRSEIDLDGHGLGQLD